MVKEEPEVIVDENPEILILSVAKEGSEKEVSCTNMHFNDVWPLDEHVSG